MVNLFKHPNPIIRRTAAVCMIPVGMVVCIFIALWHAIQEYGQMCVDTPEHFMAIWNGED